MKNAHPTIVATVWKSIVSKYAGPDVRVSLWQLGSTLFMLFAVVLAGFAAWELSQALRKGEYDVPRIPTVAAAVIAIPIAYYGGATGQLLAVLGAIVLVTVWRLVEQAVPSRRRSGTSLLRDLSAGVFVQGYVTLLATFTVVLTAADGGQWWTLAFIVIAVAADVGAYAFGLMFGKHKMAPRISPNKTWEGFAGGLVLGTVAASVLAYFILDGAWITGALVGLAAAAAAVVGDLAESAIKRDISVKDMSSFLPGHGGILDRIDSMLVAAPVAYVVFALLLGSS